jgi:amidase
MPAIIKMAFLLERYITEQYGYRYYGKAANLVRLLRAAYDQVLRDYDLLLMPTSPIKAGRLPDASWTTEELCLRTGDMLGNTAPFDVTQHPAMSIPCGRIDGLPIGTMLVGRHYDEGTIYRAAYAFEQGVDWATL